MDDKQRLHKLQNGTDTAVWAYNEIQRLRAENKKLQDIIRCLSKELSSKPSYSQLRRK